MCPCMCPSLTQDVGSVCQVLATLNSTPLHCSQLNYTAAQRIVQCSTVRSRSLRAGCREFGACGGHYQLHSSGPLALNGASPGCSDQ